jgi:hypothetical protein
VNLQAKQLDLLCERGESWRSYRGRVAHVVGMNYGTAMPSRLSAIEAGKPTGFDRIAWESPG